MVSVYVLKFNYLSIWRFLCCCSAWKRLLPYQKIGFGEGRKPYKNLGFSAKNWIAQWIYTVFGQKPGLCIAITIEQKRNCHMNVRGRAPYNFRASR